MRAIIDIGTNSVRLLLAEKDEKEEWKILKRIFAAPGSVKE